MRNSPRKVECLNPDPQQPHETPQTNSPFPQSPTPERTYDQEHVPLEAVAVPDNHRMRKATDGWTSVGGQVPSRLERRRRRERSEEAPAGDPRRAGSRRRERHRAAEQAVAHPRVSLVYSVRVQVESI